MTTLLGLLRDFWAALVGLAVLFGAGWTDTQVAGILLVATTGAALVSWIVQQRRSSAKSTF